MESVERLASPEHGPDDLFRSAHLLPDTIAGFENLTLADTVFTRKLKDLETFESRARKPWPTLLQPNPPQARRAILKQLEAAERSVVRQKRLLQTMGSMVDVFAKTSCRSVCDEVQAKLPRELRDMVYEHLFEFKTIPINDDDHYRVKRLYPDSYHPRWPCFCRACAQYSRSKPRTGKPDAGRWGVPYHIRNADWTGAAFLDELAERWYKTREGFIFHDAAKIGGFLARDGLGSRMQPAKLISNVEVLLTEDALRQIPEKRSGLWATRLFPPFSYRTEDIVRGLRELHNLTSTCCITIRILDGLDYIQGCKTYRKAVGEIFTEAVVLIREGLDVTVVPSLED